MAKESFDTKQMPGTWDSVGQDERPFGEDSPYTSHKDRFDTKEIHRTRDFVGQDEKHSSDGDSLTPYMRMSLLANEISPKYNILAAMCSWLTLAGYVVVPGAFTSLKDSEALSNSKAGKVVQNTVQKISLLVLAGFLCLLGTAGTCRLWSIHRQNYVWLRRQIFLPGLMQSIVGLLTIFVNVTTAHDKNWSITAKISIIIICIFTGNWSVLFLVYTLLLGRVKETKDEELAKFEEPTDAM